MTSEHLLNLQRIGQLDECLDQSLALLKLARQILGGGQ
jgi:hypothetical protein